MGECARFYRDHVPESVWEDIYWRLEESGRLAASLPTMRRCSPEKWLEMFTDTARPSWALTFRNEIAGVVYLTELEGTCGRIHFSTWDTSQNRQLAADDAAKNRNLSAWGQNQANQLSAWDSTQNRDLSAWGQNQANQLSAWDSGLNRQLSAYNTERDNQMKGMMFAPELAAADYQDIAALSEVGTARENYAQDQINAGMDRYNYNANRDALGLQNYMNMVSGNYGSQGSSTATGSTGAAKSNPLGGALSGGLSGAGTGAMIGSIVPGLGTGIGALIGGVGGGLLGMFG
jgi:hypothetical protein